MTRLGPKNIEIHRKDVAYLKFAYNLSHRIGCVKNHLPNIL